MLDTAVDITTPKTRRNRRLLWFGASVLARIIVFIVTLAIVIGAPVAAFLLLDMAKWTAGAGLGLLAGFVVAFAVWWAYLILHD